MRTILIVDDEPLEISLLQDMLQDENYRFETSMTAHQAREVVGALGGDIATILMDWRLPDSDGVELLKWIKAQPELENVEVIVQSKEFVSENIKKAIELGAYYYLTKPFDEPQLEAIVRAAVSSNELRRGLLGKVEETRDAFRLLEEGRFYFKTVREAELLAIHIASACASPEASMGLLELFVNAVEHGNLGITYEEKGRFLADGCLVEERKRRLASPEYRDNRVRVRLKRLGGTMEVTVRDEGNGFDYQQYMTLDESRLFDVHGRGILLAAASLDVAYVAPGNEVRILVPMDE